MDKKPNCYECKWRGDVPGDRHSCCNHPSNGKIMNDPFAQAMAILAGVGRVSPIKVETAVHVKGNIHGIRHGWFNWPFNFDPVWLEECDGYINKLKKGGGND